MTEPHTLNLPVSLPVFWDIIYRKPELVIPKATYNSLAEAHTQLQTLADNQVVYGYSTGFGPLANTYVAPAARQQLQYNLIRSHACGTGQPLAPVLVRAMMAARLVSLLQGYSAVTPPVIRQLTTFLNHDLIPLVPRHGSVGASGDLIQLAHIAQTLIGEGVLCDPASSELTDTAAILQQLNLSPLTLQGRDGLALINGTSAMTGVAAVVLHEARQLFQNTLYTTALLYETLSVNTENIHPLVGTVRAHPGQQHVADILRNLLTESSSISARDHTHPHSTSDATTPTTAPQDIYSLRCVPQILGPIYDTLQHAEHVVETELQAVTDNPLFSAADGCIHNGNFHGDYVAHEMDKVRIAITKLSVLLERQLNLLLNPALNHRFPPYLNRNTPGLDLALQAVQFVATSTVAENQTLATPIVTHSIPTNNDNQDVVSMGCNSALLTRDVITNSFEVHAALSMAVVEAVDLAGVTPAPAIQPFYTDLQTAMPALDTDRSLRTDLAHLVTVLQNYTHRDSV